MRNKIINCQTELDNTVETELYSFEGFRERSRNVMVGRSPEENKPFYTIHFIAFPLHTPCRHRTSVISALSLTIFLTVCSP